MVPKGCSGYYLTVSWTVLAVQKNRTSNTCHCGILRIGIDPQSLQFCQLCLRNTFVITPFVSETMCQQCAHVKAQGAFVPRATARMQVQGSPQAYIGHPEMLANMHAQMAPPEMLPDGGQFLSPMLSARLAAPPMLSSVVMPAPQMQSEMLASQVNRQMISWGAGLLLRHLGK